MVKSAVYDWNQFIGEAEIYPENSNIGNWVREIRISHFSPPSERCPPLAVLRAIAESGICFKMEAFLLPAMISESPLLALHTDCLRDNKTAVIQQGEEEVHLVAMVSRKISVPNACFWCFSIPKGLYVSSLSMLNLRCLGLVFDLDETLIVANSMRSFEDKIDALQRKISTEPDGQRAAGMLAEIKRYQDDKYILKQFVDSDQIVDNGKVLKAQSEILPPLPDSQQITRRPVIRLQEKNIILTRVNPKIRDTSVLVRLRPAWEDLRSYLTAKGRKRFEVYVCTMAERDYALEMWRLLDPDSSLINSNQFLERIVCVKSGSRKSLLNVFQEGKCHPKMALVIDDRLKVWDEKDQPRVHVVPAFAPYYAPQAEANKSTPVLCVARNVACNVRGGFFKDFDGGVLPQISEVCYEDNMKDIPTAPDVGSYLVSEDAALTSNFSKDQLHLESMAEADRERILEDASNSIQAVEPMITNLGSRTVTPLQHIMTTSSSASMMTAMPMVMSVPSNHFTQPATSVRPLNQLAVPEHGFHSSTEEGEIQEPEMDPDARRRLLILQHGQDTRDLTSSFPVAPPVPVPPVQQPGLWFPLEQDINSRNPNRMDRDFNLEPEFVSFERRRHRPPVFLDEDNIFVHSENGFRENRRFPIQLNHGVENARPNNISSKLSFQGCELPISRISASHRADLTELHVSQRSESVVGFLQKIAMSLGTKVEFHYGLCHATDLQFSVEVWFVGEKIGQAVGKTRKEAQHRAAEISLHNLAHKFLTNSHSSPNTLPKALLEPLQAKGNGFISESNSYGYRFSDRDDVSPVASTSQDSRFFYQRLDALESAPWRVIT